MRMALHLNAPGMTSLHKAGLAGLFMTLRVLETTGQTIKGLNWQLESNQVVLDWVDGQQSSALEELLKRSFWIDKDGFIRLTGLEGSSVPRPDQKYLLYTALLNSFLQFGRHRTKGPDRILSYTVDDKQCWIRAFAPIKEYRHQVALSDFIDKSGGFRKTVEAAGWLYPGAGQRHVVYSETKLNESPESALCLLFAPVGVVFYTISSRSKGRKARLAMLIPEIVDLSAYADLRQVLAQQGAFELTASSASDAVLRMLITIKSSRVVDAGAEMVNHAFACRILTFGIVDWNEKQKSRTAVYSVFSGGLPGLDNYRTADAIFGNRWQLAKAKFDRKGKEIEPARSFIATSSAREFIAENIAHKTYWYYDLAGFLSSKPNREQLQYEREELYKMVESASYEDDSEHLFIRVCHEAWRRRLGKLGQRARTENANFSSLARKEGEKLRSTLSRCKNAETLRETVVDFWSRAGANADLRGGGLEKLMWLFDENNWKRGRDLALLALISYQPKDEEEEQALVVDTTPDEGGENE